MEVELVLGPYDGMLWEVPDEQSLVILQEPAMTVSEFLAAEQRPDLVNFAVMRTVQHAYVRDRKKLSKAGRHRYIYAGIRQ